MKGFGKRKPNLSLAVESSDEQIVEKSQVNPNFVQPVEQKYHPATTTGFRTKLVLANDEKVSQLQGKSMRSDSMKSTPKSFC